MEQPLWNQQLAFPPYGYQYKPYPFYPPMQQMQEPPYWLGKRQHHSNKDKETEPEKRGHMSDADYYDSLEQETFNKQLLNAVNKHHDHLDCKTCQNNSRQMPASKGCPKNEPVSSLPLCSPMNPFLVHRLQRCPCSASFSSPILRVRLF